MSDDDERKTTPFEYAIAAVITIGVIIWVVMPSDDGPKCRSAAATGYACNDANDRYSPKPDY